MRKLEYPAYILDMAPGDCGVLPVLYEYLGDHMFQSDGILDSNSKIMAE
jgi:hypothetical protein